MPVIPFRFPPTNFPDPQLAVAQVWKPPKGFVFPTTTAYVSHLTAGAAAIKPIVMSKVESFIAPLKMEAAGAIATLESTTGLSLSDKNISKTLDDIEGLIASVKSIKKASTFQEASTACLALVNGTLGVATDLFKAVPQVAKVLSVAPKVMQTASMVLGIAISIVQSIKTGDQKMHECLEEVRAKIPEYCKGIYQNQLVLGTDENGNPLPTDIFRHYLYGIESPSLASMYVGLCGKQIRNGWSQPAPKEVGKISSDTRRLMWYLIEGIMSATEPAIGGGSRDGGRILYPSLQGIVYNEFAAKRLSEDDVYDLAGQIASRFGIRTTCDVSPEVLGFPVGPAVGEGKIRSVYVWCKEQLQASLADAFFKSILNTQNAYRKPEFKWNPVTQKWDLEDVKLSDFKRPTSIIKMASKMPAVKTILEGSYPAKKDVFTAGSSFPMSPALVAVLGGGAAAWYWKKRRS